MKSREYTTMFTAVIVASLCSPASAQPYTCANAGIEFTGADRGAWQDENNWYPVRIPDSDDIVCIPSEYYAAIDVGVCDGGTNDGLACNSAGTPCPGGGTCDLSVDDDVVALAIVVDGILELINLTTLTISDDSDVDGDFRMLYDAKLLLGASLTITGNGGKIGMPQDACGWGDPRIESVSPGSYTLTLDSTTATYCDLTLMGRLYIDVVVDNRACVLANFHHVAPLDFPVTVAKDGNTGPGEWIVDPLDGTPCEMIFDGEVDGAGTFTVGAGSDMRFNDACTSLTGGFDVDGVLWINQNVTTTGDLTLSDGGIIRLAANKIASFSQ